jgi:3-mercaptopropionate dioxygenase
LREGVIESGTLPDSTSTESVILGGGASLLKDLIHVDDWLPARYAEPDLELYRQYLLPANSSERFSVVSFVWGPVQTNPIHDHTVWGLIGMRRGEEHEQHYGRTEHGRLVEQGAPHFLAPGEVDVVSPTVGDLHRVSNALSDHVSIRIRVYGANIGGVRRWIYESSGAKSRFIFGSSNTGLPNPWDRSKEDS